MRMPHVFEPAATGRSKCRGCKQPLAKGELRFGEGLPNPFGEGEVTHWFHPACAAYKRPDVLLEGLAAAACVADRASLERIARASLAAHRLPRIDGAERAPTGQAKCRHCHAPIGKGGWRVRLVFHEEGTFSPGGFLHLACRQAYFETGDILEQLLHFSPALPQEEREALRAEFG
ncbi:MAG: PARP-type zinc finger-containing protein [Pseudomonadota bacterium]|nr:PARP-type zinc finger-containing protein [Pseudomonadota bacterium]